MAIRKNLTPEARRGLSPWVHRRLASLGPAAWRAAAWSPAPSAGCGRWTTGITCGPT